MYSGIRAGFFYPFAESAKHFLTINAFATVKAVNALQQLRFQFFKCFRRLGQTHDLVFLETAETGADDFTGGLIKPALDFFFHKLCQFRRQRYIHNGISIKFTSLGIIARITGMSQILLLDKIFQMDGICPTGLGILPG